MPRKGKLKIRSQNKISFERKIFQHTGLYNRISSTDDFWRDLNARQNARSKNRAALQRAKAPVLL